MTTYWNHDYKGPRWRYSSSTIGLWMQHVPKSEGHLLIGASGKNTEDGGFTFDAIAPLSNETTRQLGLKLVSSDLLTTESGGHQVFWHERCKDADCSGDGWYFDLTNEDTGTRHYSFGYKEYSHALIHAEIAEEEWDEFCQKHNDSCPEEE